MATQKANASGEDAPRLSLPVPGHCHLNSQLKWAQDHTLCLKPRFLNLEKTLFFGERVF